MKETQLTEKWLRSRYLNGFQLALMICLLITALFTVFHVEKDRREQERIEYDRMHFAPIQQGL